MNWYSTEREVVATDSKGYITGLTVGSTSVIVEDRNNPLNRAKVTVWHSYIITILYVNTSPPLLILLQVVVGNVPPISLRVSSHEVLVGDTVALHVGVWDWVSQEGGQYDCFSCEASSILWDVRGDAFFVDETSANSIAASDSELLKG